MRVRTSAISAVAAVAAVAGMMLAAGCQAPDAVNEISKATLPKLTVPASILPSGVTTHWTMPNVIGMNLQTAQDTIQKITHDGIFYTSSHDVTGKGRHQILDRDWKVCSQNVPAGAAITIGTKIDLGAAKTAESCP
jgi:PASTA domain